MWCVDLLGGNEGDVGVIHKPHTVVTLQEVDKLGLVLNPVGLEIDRAVLLYHLPNDGVNVQVLDRAIGPTAGVLVFLANGVVGQLEGLDGVNALLGGLDGLGCVDKPAAVALQAAPLGLGVEVPAGLVNWRKAVLGSGLGSGIGDDTGGRAGGLDGQGGAGDPGLVLAHEERGVGTDDLVKTVLEQLLEVGHATGVSGVGDGGEGDLAVLGHLDDVEDTGLLLGRKLRKRRGGVFREIRRQHHRGGDRGRLRQKASHFCQIISDRSKIDSNLGNNVHTDSAKINRRFTIFLL